MGVRLEAIDGKILALLYLGYSQAAISRHVHISRRTVQRRIGFLMELLEAASLVALGARAQEIGLLPPAVSVISAKQ
ncbi:winged helix-turn-helix transcriptional regulator [Nonomuraea sp. NPDC050643]|uniref:winged helix-turn-helix transcriptional regulator n=1 Tax=Nonomuraea sp. NPDC050643 TaxID=3155660 RepID=UPI0033DDADF9